MSNYDPMSIYQSAEYRQELAVQRSFMARVYGWMTLGLLCTAITSLFVASDIALVKLIFNTGLFWVMVIAELAIAFGLGFGLRKLPVAAVAGLFILYSVLTGATLSIVLLVFTASSVAATFFITAGMFGGMSAWGYLTKRNLDGFGHFLMMGFWGLLIAMLVNLFLQSSAMEWFISFIGVIVFTGLAAYDTQKIKQMYAVSAQGTAMYAKTALYGAFALYLDFINLFMFLLQFMGQRRD